MKFERKTKNVVNANELNRQAANQLRLQCAFPVNIKGFNLLGENYNEIALVKNITQNGLCIRTFQELVPGSIFTLYKMDHELDTVGIFQVVWSKQWNDRIRELGAQLL